jgi:putative addiction module component (TIGR02574 family)
MKHLGLDALSVADRLELMEPLWDSIVEIPESLPMTDAQMADLDRRLDECSGDPAAGSPWEEVLARLRASR